MSGSYYKVIPEPAKPEVYGFKKVGKSEMTEIVSRLSKPTYNCRVQSLEPHKAHNYPHLHATLQPRTPSSCIRRVQDCQVEPGQDSRKFTERELQRVLRRIQKPTRAHLLSRNNYRNNDRDIDIAAQSTSRPVSSTNLEKTVKHLSRPTTASKAKHTLECYLCLDDEREINRMLVPFEYMYADDRIATSNEVRSIVSRLSSSTRASGRGSSVCCRLSPDYTSLHVQSPQLPLVSGLARTKSVQEIVDRLHGNQENRTKRYHGYSTMKTQITNYVQ